MNTHPLQPYWTEKAKAAMRAGREEGRHLGKAPLGYINVIINGEPAVVPDPETASHVQSVFLLATTGKYSVRGMLPAVARIGLTARNGRPIQASSLYAILTNPFYTGMVRHGNKLVPGRHAPLVDEKVFAMVQRKLASGIKKT